MSSMWIDEKCVMEDYPDISNILVDGGTTANHILIDEHNYLMDSIRKCYIAIKVSPNNKDVINGNLNKWINEFDEDANIIRKVVESGDGHLMVSKVFELGSSHKLRFEKCPHCVQKFLDQKEIFNKCEPVYYPCDCEKCKHVK